MSRVIGTYRCGCSYGPISEKHRLEYCGKHGDDIQSECPCPQPIKTSKRKKQRTAKEEGDDIARP